MYSNLIFMILKKKLHKISKCDARTTWKLCIFNSYKYRNDILKQAYKKHCIILPEI
jgi:hypothetical protein